MKTELLITIKQRFIPFNLFLFFLRIRLASLWLANLMITFLGPLLFNQWQYSMFEGSTDTSNLSKILMVVFSRSSLLTLSGTPKISKHSHLEYWLFPQHCLSSATTNSYNLLFTFFETDNSDSTFLKSLRSWLSSLLILNIVLSNFDWYSKVNVITSFLVSFLKAASESDILIGKTSLMLLTGS